MSRFDADLLGIQEHTKTMMDMLEQSVEITATSQYFSEMAAINNRVSRIRERLEPEDHPDIIKAWLRLENRMKRLHRLLDLRAPFIILQDENSWLRLMTSHMEMYANGIQPTYTEGELEELEQFGELETSFDEEDIPNRIQGALFGLAIGDAMGAATEFMEPDEIQRKFGRVTDFLGGGWFNLLPGETTDDTAMTICVAEGIIETPDHPIEAIGQAFLRWEASNPPDIGITIRHVFQHYRGDWMKAAQQAHLDLDGKSAGNGSLMRCLPVALAYRNREKMEEITVLQSKMTHFDDLASEACLLYNRIAFDVLHGNHLRYAIVDHVANTRYQNVFLSRPSCSPDGYVVHTFTWVLYLLWNFHSFQEVILEATNEGYDADTVAAIAGGLSGLFHGVGSIKYTNNWVERLQNANRLSSLAEELFQLRQSQGSDVE